MALNAGLDASLDNMSVCKGTWEKIMWYERLYEMYRKVPGLGQKRNALHFGDETATYT
jgi:hypothetical protein